MANLRNHMGVFQRLSFYLALSFGASGGVLLALGNTVASAQGNIPAVTGDARVDKLLSQMTLAEKLTLIHDER